MLSKMSLKKKPYRQRIYKILKMVNNVWIYCIYIVDIISDDVKRFKDKGCTWLVISIIE